MHVVGKTLSLHMFRYAIYIYACQASRFKQWPILTATTFGCPKSCVIFIGNAVVIAYINDTQLIARIIMVTPLLLKALRMEDPL